LFFKPLTQTYHLTLLEIYKSIVQPPNAEAMKPLLFAFFSLLWLACNAQIDSLAAESKVDSTGYQQTSADEETQNAKRILNFGVHIDYGKILTIPFDFENKYEGGVVIEFLDNIEFVGEYGYWDKESKQAIANGTYNATGSYWRIGSGVSFPFNTPGNRIGLGFRYAESTFDDTGTYEISSVDGLTNPFESSFSRKDLSASWISGVLTSVSDLKIQKKNPESALNKMFKIGFQFRWRFLRSYDRVLEESDPIEVYTIPGYGRTLSDNTVAFNFFLRWYPLGF